VITWMIPPHYSQSLVIMSGNWELLHGVNGNNEKLGVSLPMLGRRVVYFSLCCKACLIGGRVYSTFCPSIYGNFGLRGARGMGWMESRRKVRISGE
jgi:hypothetical protein